MTYETETNRSSSVRLLGSIQRVTGIASALMLLLIMAVTVIDTFGRYFFNRPLSGAAEWVELTMGLMVFAGMFQATLHREHIRLDLLDHFWSPGAERVLKLISGVISLAIMLIFAWPLWRKVTEMHDFQDISSYLGVPLAPVGFFMLVMIVLCASIYLVEVCNCDLFKRRADLASTAYNPHNQES